VDFEVVVKKRAVKRGGEKVRVKDKIEQGSKRE